MIYGDVIHGRKRSQCLCECECGNTKIILSDDLKSGHIISCGCDTRQRRINANRRDLTGKRFGRLVVLSMSWKDDGKGLATCMCDCGNTTIVNSASLPSGKTQSCGCLQRERASCANEKDWTGVVSDYGVKFIKQTHKNEQGQWLWECECGECGKIFETLPAKILSGHTTSCGCRRRSSHEAFIKKLLDDVGVDYIQEYRFSDCKDKYTLPFDFAIMDGDHPSVLIEYDGQQHYKPIEFFGGEEQFNLRQSHDQIKNEYCKKHGILLLRIPYFLSTTEIKQKLSNVINP